MKNLLLILFALVLIFSSCKRNTNFPPVKEGFNTLVVEPGFDWKTSRDVNFEVNNLTEGVLKVTSTDGMVYYKSFASGRMQSETFTVNLPVYFSSVLINGNEVEINGDMVSYTLPSFKSVSRGAYSLKLDGNNDYAIVSNPKGYDNLEKLSVEAWVKFDQLGGEYKWIVQKNSCFGFKLSPSGNSYKPTAILYLNGKYKDVACNWKDRLKDTNVWYHLAFTWDGKKVRIYINGELKKKKKLNGKILARNTNLSIGGNDNGTRVINGNLSEVRIWSKGLKYKELVANMNNSLTGSEDGLTAYYPVNQGSGTTLFDKSNNQQNANINGATWSTEIPFAGNDTDGDGVVDNDDEYPADPTKAFNNYFPVSGYGSLAFEDMWPIQGDYDFNDLVVDYQFQTVTDASNKIVETNSSFAVRAFGAGMHNGFGFQLPNNNLSGSIVASGSQINYNYVTLNADGIEQGQDKPTLVVFDDAYNTLEYPGSGIGVNTTPGVTYVEPDTIDILMTYTPNTFTLQDLNISAFNPFMMANMERGKEIHLPDYPPTTLADESYFGSEADDSNPDQGRYYKTDDNFPWALNIYENFSYANEKTDILDAYNHFADWATSSGNSFSDWYLDEAGYRNSNAIYQIPEEE